MQERRRYVRLNIALDVSYVVQGKEGSRYKSITKNVSPSGARFATETELPKGTVLNLDIKLPTENNPIPVKAKVVWSKKENEKEKDTFDAGFEFIDIPEESKKVFFQYLCNLMYDQLKEIK